MTGKYVIVWRNSNSENVLLLYRRRVGILDILACAYILGWVGMISAGGNIVIRKARPKLLAGRGNNAF